MKTIWKQPVVPNTTSILLPQGSKLLTVQLQREEMMIWAMVDPEAPKASIPIDVVGTGHLVDQDSDQTYLGTVVTHGGLLVWHVFYGVQA